MRSLSAWSHLRYLGSRVSSTAPLAVSVNFIGTTPVVALKTLFPADLNGRLHDGHVNGRRFVQLGARPGVLCVTAASRNEHRRKNTEL